MASGTDTRIVIEEMRRVGKHSEWLGYTADGKEVSFRYANGHLTVEMEGKILIDRQVGGTDDNHLRYSFLRRYAAADKFNMPEREYHEPWLDRILRFSW